MNILEKITERTKERIEEEKKIVPLEEVRRQAEEKGIKEDGQVYLPISWVNEYVNERFYWDETEKLLVYALREEFVYADESDMGEQGPLLKVKEGEAYLMLGLIMNNSDIRLQSFDTSQI